MILIHVYYCCKDLILMQHYILIYNIDILNSLLIGTISTFETLLHILLLINEWMIYELLK